MKTFVLVNTYGTSVNICGTIVAVDAYAAAASISCKVILVSGKGVFPPRYYYLLIAPATHSTHEWFLEEVNPVLSQPELLGKDLVKYAYTLSWPWF